MLREIKITFQPEGKRIKVPIGTDLLAASQLAGLAPSSICGGKGICGKCKIIIRGSYNPGPLTEMEARFLTDVEVEEGYRLACQVSPESDLTVEVPLSSRPGRQRLQTEGITIDVKLKPAVKKFHVELTKPTLQSIVSDEDLLLTSLASEHGLNELELDHEVLKALSRVIREEWAVTVALWGGKRIISVESGDVVNRCYGLALDVGTTKMAGFLLDLTSGRTVSVSSLMNPQIHYGEDVISRITYVNERPNGLEVLQKAVIAGVNNIIDDCCSKAAVRPDEIYEIAVVGNTAMHHIALGISPVSLALAPYAPVVRRGTDVDSAKLGIKTHPQANVHFLPNIGGFVGADNVGVILSTGILDSDDISLCLDIGTNTEVVLGNADGVDACSCASGPAFEGAHIRYGMRAATGAIEKVDIDASTFAVKYGTVDGSKPIGLCGSGLIDTLAEFLKVGIMDASGKIDGTLKTHRIRTGSDGIEFIIVPKSEALHGQDIVITQKDIRELQKAKAAIHTGVEILLKSRQLTEDDVDRMFLAGAFGSYIAPDSARMIGMYPEISLEKISVVGNAAGAGAKMAMLSEVERNKADEISENVRYVELATVSSFKEEYLNSMFFPHIELRRYPLTVQFLNKLGRIHWSRFQAVK